MNHRIVLAALAAAAFLAAPAYTVAATAGHSHGEAATLSLDHGKKWATDEPLRRGMGEIRRLVQGERKLAKEQRTAAYYKSLGDEVERQVARIVAECKLPPAADANLHIIVADLLAASHALQGHGDEKPAAAMKQARHALEQYAHYFEHPGFLAGR